MDYNAMDKKKQEAETKEDISKEEEVKYGWFSFTPSWIQWMNNIIAFTALMTIGNTFASGTTNGFCGVAQGQIERRFQLTSQQSSWIGTAYELTTIPVTIFIAYIGSKGVHRPRWTACGLIFTSLGCFLYALPQFTTPEYKPFGENEDDNNLCTNRTEDICQGNEDGGGGDLSNYLYVFILARVCLAIGSSPMYQLGVTFMDDCLIKRKFSLYTSIFAAGGILGPAMGYILGGYFLTLWTDFPSTSDPGIDQSDPRWIGAWWLGFLVSGFGVILVIIPMSGYPYDLPGAKEIRATKTSEAFNAKADVIPEDMRHINFTAKDVPRYLKDIFTNWTFIFLSMYICCDIAILGGMALYAPKLIEVQFELTPGAAGALCGLLVVPAGVVGTVMGGLLVDKLNLSIVGIMKTEIFMSIFVLSCGGCLLLYCNSPPFAGIDTPYPASHIESYSDYNLTVTCNADCTCDNVPYDPVCSVYELQYFSPCHAGCQDIIETEDGPREYYNCSCIPYNSTLWTDPEATSGSCPAPPCDALVPFSILLFLAMTGLFMSEAMNISAIFRVVPNTHRLFASMCQSIMLRLFGTVPAPLIFGAAFDASCILWQDNCGSQGSCYLYDKQQLAILMFTVNVSYKLGALLFMICAWCLYKSPQIQILDEIEIKESDVTNKEDLTKPPSTSDLNKAFDNEYIKNELSNEKHGNSTKLPMNVGVVNPALKSDAEKGQATGAHDLSDERVNDFFVADMIPSPAVSSKILSTTL